MDRRRRRLPGLAQLDTLVANATQAGLPTELRVSGAAAALPMPTDLRHAGPAEATVSLTYSDAELLIEVADNGAGAPQNVSKDGHGLIGMRERVAAAGGTMQAGSAPGGGYLVSARLPVRTKHESQPQ